MFLKFYSLFSLMLVVCVLYYKQKKKKKIKTQMVEEQVLECRLVIDKEN